MLTELSGNELYCLAQKDFTSGDMVIGNCVNSLGLSEKLESTLNESPGKELSSFTQMLEKGRMSAYNRMIEKVSSDTCGIIGVSNELFLRKNNLEFISSGSIVTTKNQRSNKSIFSTSGNGKTLFALLDAEYLPISFIFGNIAYSTSMTGGIIGKLKMYSRGEVKPLSDLFSQTRRLALERMIDRAKQIQANAIIDVNITTLVFKNLNEMLATGTAAQNDLFRSSPQMVTSTLSNEEVWSLAKMGYAPKQIIMDTCVFSLGFMNGFKSVFKLLPVNENPELTVLFDHARKSVFSRIKEKALMINAQEIIGIKTYVYHLGNDLFEFVAIGTAIEKLPGIKTQSEQLPMQIVAN